MSELASPPTHAFSADMPAHLASVPTDPAPFIKVVPKSGSPDIQEVGLQQQDGDDLHQNGCAGCHTTGSRNLVICIDGTLNQFSTKNTNVLELYSRIVKDEHQLALYNSGIGTYARPSWKSWSYHKQVIANKLDLAFALRFEKIILGAYAWLVDNYKPGDRIFLFGFSTGAYQVRALAAMIDTVGLLYKGNSDQIPFAYELYAASDDRAQWPESGHPTSPLRRLDVGCIRRMPSSEHEDELANDVRPPVTESFKQTFSQSGVRVHFVGAWDTVSSPGFIRRKTLPGTTDGMKSTCFFRHALALHEFRVNFLPEYARGSHGPGFEDFPAGVEPHTKEVWFAGSHSDIGGVSTANSTLDRFGPALRWMSREATVAGLRIKEGRRKWELGKVSKSMPFFWRILECLPIQRLSYPHWDPEMMIDSIGSHRMHTVGSPSRPTTRLPHLGAHRNIQPGQLVDRSVRPEQVPFQLPPFSRKEGDMDPQLVLRPLRDALRRGRILDEESSGVLNQLVSSANGIESLNELKIMEYIYSMARACGNTGGTQQIWKDLQSLHAAFVTGLFNLRNGTQQHPADITETTSSDTFPFHMCGHTDSVTSVAFLSSAHLVSGSQDQTIRLWDICTGEATLGSPISDLGSITCVAVHAATGRIASASELSRIRLWTTDGHGAVYSGRVLQDTSMRLVLEVAFSPDGSHIVSGSTDRAIRVWNASTGELVGEPVRGHSDWVRSVAFTSDGRRVVTGSGDRTMRLWEWSPVEATLRQCGEPLTGHSDSVSSVAFSPDGADIASGSRDKTVRLWDVASRTSKFALEGHLGAVNSIAFAPSGTHLVSGSDDWTVRLWDTRTGAAVRVLRGHTDRVLSVAFSPDGTRIASGSRDTTVRVWDFVVDVDESRPEDDAGAAPV